MKKINVIIKVLICILTAVVMITGCSQEDKLAEANANAMMAGRMMIPNILEQQEKKPSGYLIKGNDYNLDIGGMTFDKSYFTQFVGDDWHGYIFGELNSEKNSVEYILWSESPIPSQYKELLTQGDQELALNDDIIIGCYPTFY